jgi:hypothetical protein
VVAFFFWLYPSLLGADAIFSGYYNTLLSQIFSVGG